MFSKKAVLKQGCLWAQADKMNRLQNEFTQLQERLFSEDWEHKTCRTAYNLLLLNKSLFLRLDELSYAITDLFNNGRILSTLIIARSLFETAIFLSHIENKIGKKLKRLEETSSNKKDLDELNNLLINKMFASRKTDFLEEIPEIQATNFQTILEYLENEMKEHSVTDTYEILSEYAHSNALGHVLAFTKTDLETG